MSSQPFIYPLIASLLIHLGGLASASLLVDLRGQSPPVELIPIQLITAAPAPPVPPPPPPKEPPRPRQVQKITPPRIIEKTDLKLGEPTSKLTSIEEPVIPSVVQLPVPYPSEAKELLPGPLPAPTAKAEGGEAGAGKLSTRGDVAVLPGIGIGGGSGGPGRSGLGGEGAGGGAGGPVRLARPQGGYQIKPNYPESARRQGIDGVTILKFRVLENGTVGEMVVEQSAGYQDLDRAAAEAVKKWRFEPARRGNQRIAVWVVLPVRFELR